MLVLSRKVGQKIVIDNDIILYVHKIEGNRVYLGFEAPQQVDIQRKEIWDETHGKSSDQTS